MPKYSVVVMRKRTTYERCAGTIEADNQTLADDMVLDMAKHGRFTWTPSKTPLTACEVYVESTIEHPDAPAKG